MGLLAVTRGRRAPLAVAVLAAGLLAAPAAQASDVIALVAPKAGGQVKSGTPVVFRFTALTQSSTVLPKIEVSTSGRVNADGSFVHADVVETTTAKVVAGVANTYRVTSHERWTRQPATYYWHA